MCVCVCVCVCVCARIVSLVMDHLRKKINCKDGTTFTHVSRYVAYNFEPIEPIGVLLSVLSVLVVGVNKILTFVTDQQKYPRCCIYFVT